MKRIILITVALLLFVGCSKMNTVGGQYTRTAKGVVEVIELNTDGTYNVFNTDRYGNIDGRVESGHFTMSKEKISFDGKVTFKSEYYSTSNGQIAEWHNYTPISGSVSGSILTVVVKDEEASRWGLFADTEYEDKGTKTLTFAKK